MKKKIFMLLVAATLYSAEAMAQKTAYETTVDGVKVIVQPSGNEIVEIQTIIKGGVQNYPVGKAGIESMAMSALTECGTLKQDKNSFKNALDKVSAQVYGYAQKDFATIRMNCIKGDFNVVWPLYVEAITQPKFDTTEFSRIRQDAINSLKSQESDPDAGIDLYADKVAFQGKSYATNPSGTVASLQSLTADETHKYYQKVLERSRMIVVVVADLNKADIEARVKKMLDVIKPGAPYKQSRSFFTLNQNTFAIEQQDLATNYIEGVASSPETGMADFNAFAVAMRIFSNRHFIEVRTNNGLSYAPQVWYVPGAISVAKFSVTTTQPDKYIEVFNKLVEKIKAEGFTKAEVEEMKNIYLTSFYDRLETNEAQASVMAGNEVLFDNWRRSFTLVDEIKKLSLSQINDAFRKYIRNITWVYHGDPKKVTPANFTNENSKRPDNPVVN